jgi:secreted trypsin-like serine protease
LHDFTAHCFYDGENYSSGLNYVVAMGSLDRWTRDNNTLYIRVLEAIGHEGFDLETFANDIGLMVLSEEVPMNHPTARPIKLSTLNAVEGKSCQVRFNSSNFKRILLIFCRFQAGER